MRHTIRILCHAGDEPLTYDPAQESEVQAAKDRVGVYLGAGYALFAVDSSDRTGGRRLRAFDPAVKEAVLVPPLVGG